jgi:hypothetical protein
MVAIEEGTIFIIRCMLFGVITGIVLLGLFFYVINLTGNYKSIQSLAFVFSNFGLLALTIVTTLPPFVDPEYHIYITMGFMLAAPAGCGYFVILFYNSYSLCSKKDIAAIIVTILPLIVTGFIPNTVVITRYFELKDNIDLELVHYIMIIFDMLIYVIVNSICYRRFCQYVNDNSMKLLLYQYKMGIISVFLIDVVICTVAFNIRDVIITDYCTISIVNIGLTMEYFLLYRLRNQVTVLIQEANA